MKRPFSRVGEQDILKRNMEAQNKQDAKQPEDKAETEVDSKPKEDTPKTEVKQEETVDSTDKQPEQKTEPENKDQPVEEKTEPSVEEKKETQPTSTEIEDKQLLDILNKRTGNNYASLEEYDKYQKPEEKKETPKKEVEKDKDIARLQRFKELNPGKGIAEFIELQKDWSKVSDIDAVRSQLKDEYGDDLSKEEADLLIKKNLGLDVEDDLNSLDESEKLELRAQARKYRNKKTASQEEVLQSLDEEQPAEETDRRESDVVTLVNGEQISKADYEKARETYLNENKRVAESTESYDFSFQFSNNGSNETIKVPYNVTDADREQILSATESVTDPQVLNRYAKDGKFDHAAYQKAKLFELKGEKIIQAIASNAYSLGIESLAKEERNIKFTKKDEPKQQEKKSVIPKEHIPTTRSPFGTKRFKKFNKQN